MQKILLVGLLVLASACTDKAKEPFDKATTLDGHEESLDEALALYQAAVAASPDSEYGKMAQERVAVLEKQLAEPPSAVSIVWCARLRRRLEDRYFREVLAKDSSRGESYVRTVVQDYVLNLEYDCRKSAGKPTAGRWVCLWNSSFDNYDKCGK